MVVLGWLEEKGGEGKGEGGRRRQIRGCKDRSKCGHKCGRWPGCSDETFALEMPEV